MSLRATSWAWEQQLPPSGKLVLLALADRADDHGRHSWPSAGTLGKRTGLDARTVRRVLRSLETAGLISRGDQRRVASIPAYSRPVVWDLNLAHAAAPPDTTPGGGVTPSPGATPPPGVVVPDPLAARQGPAGTTPGAPGHHALQTVLEQSLNSPGNDPSPVAPLVPLASVEHSTPSTTGSELLGWFRDRHGALPRAVAAKLGKQIDQLVADGISDPDIRAALTTWASRTDNPAPGLLPHLVPRRTASTYTDWPTLRPGGRRVVSSGIASHPDEAYDDPGVFGPAKSAGSDA